MERNEAVIKKVPFCRKNRQEAEQISLERYRGNEEDLCLFLPNVKFFQ